MTRTLAGMLAVVLVAAAGRPGARAEEKDATRLDVERLPPEAITVTRDMYSVGWHVGAELGAQGVAFGAGRYLGAGPLLRVGLGYDVLPWLAFGALVGMSSHMTDAPAPPASTALQLYTTMFEARAQVALGARAASWLSGRVGFGWASGDVLRVYDFTSAGDPGATYGGALGFDYHMYNAHHSLGVASGVRLQPNLDERLGESALAIESTAYLRYVF